ncbi:hypothetical protein RD792_009360 [Penstemon davidsonii]|uniref:Protease Do-like PDZ domain-containing protein n=1 Tax=Penstemon davidsonii TaxID=160366 RepID=A0ABR0D080_9LAMI|nr:hypothetical protein RD792_009360 [Penstemon davidsonii]
MAIAAANWWFSTVTSSGCATSHRLFSTSRRPTCAFSVRKHSSDQNSAIQKFLRGSRDRKPFSNADGRTSRNKTGRYRSASFNSIGVENKGDKEIIVDLKEQQVQMPGTEAPNPSNKVNNQYAAFINFLLLGMKICRLMVPEYQQLAEVEQGNLEDDAAAAAFLNAVVKVYCTHTEPDYSLPWQKQRQYTSTGRHARVKVKRRGDDTKYVAKVLARGVECDIALLSVESENFWRGAEPLQFGSLPNLQDSVTVVGYPLGGETISVSKGVVSRIEVTSYAHGSSQLLGIQIDAAINPGNSGGPAFNDQGECIGVAFQVYRSEEVENIGYVIPSTVVSHFLEDYERNGKYTGFPSLGVLLQKLENPALRACLKVPSNEGVLVQKIEPTSDASNVLKEGDVIVSFDNIRVGCEGTVPFRSSERIAFRYLPSQKFTGDVAELGIIRRGQHMQVQVVVNTRVHLVPYHIKGGQPSYLTVAGLVFTPLSEPLIQEECEDSIGLKLLTKARYSMAKFKGEQIVILSQVYNAHVHASSNNLIQGGFCLRFLLLYYIQVLANEVNIGYEDMSNEQATCKDKFLVFEFEDNFMIVLERESALAASTSMLKNYGIPSERSEDLLIPYVDYVGQNEATDELEFGDSPVSNSEFGYDGLLWA